MVFFSSEHFGSCQHLHNDTRLQTRSRIVACVYIILHRFTVCFEQVELDKISSGGMTVARFKRVILEMEWDRVR